MFTEFQTHFLKRKLMFVTHEHWFGVALGIPQNTKYLQKTLPEGTSTFRNVLQCPSPLLDLPLWCKVAENSQLYLHFLRIFLWLKNTSNGQRYMVGIPLVLC